MHKPTFAISLWLVAAAGLAGTVAPRDGRNLDPGAAMTERHEGAPAELDRVRFLLGDWQVTYCPGDLQVSGLMEALYTPDFDGAGTSRSTLAFLSFIPSAGQWAWAEGDSFTEAIRMANGAFDGDTLVLRDAVRPRGGARLVELEHRFLETPQGFRYELTESADGGSTWKVRQRRTYTPTPAEVAAPEPASELGSAAAGLPEAAREFDFLLGRWTSRHDLKLPNGANPRWTSNSTARYALDGHAVLEFDWFDTDPNLPSAATTILRIYNRAMMRWECLFLTNRTNSPLYFGGRRQGDEIVLHLVAHNTADPQISRFVFHDIGDDRYGWYSNVSRDRSRTFTPQWTIEVTRETPAATTGAGER